MLFKKKKEELSDQFAVYQERGAPRWGTPKQAIHAGISIEGFEGEGQVGNISVTGCSLQSVNYVSITPDKIYKARIIPEADDNMEPFDLILKLNWTKSSETLFQAGFSLENSQGNSQLNRYVELLKARGIQPDYGNIDESRRTEH